MKPESPSPSVRLFTASWSVSVSKGRRRLRLYFHGVVVSVRLLRASTLSASIFQGCSCLRP